MNIFPAIDLYDGKAVRLFKGDYNKMTVYSENPLEVAKGFKAAGAEYIHMVDLEGAKSNCVSTPNLSVVEDVAKNTGLFVEIGGGIRNARAAFHQLPFQLLLLFLVELDLLAEDPGKELAGKKGLIDEGLFTDGLHPNEEGYKRIVGYFM